jgi:hypothetical protein
MKTQINKTASQYQGDALLLCMVSQLNLLRSAPNLGNI